jgi:hypothetical protein
MNRTWSVLVLTAAICLTRVLFGAAQNAAQPAQPPAEKVFKNIQVMKGVPVDEFLGSMGFISNALAVNCTYCHLGEGGGGWDEYAKDNPKKVMARTMIVMVNTINKTHFGGRPIVTCVTCHNGSNVPATIRKLDAVYNTPTPMNRSMSRARHQARLRPNRCSISTSRRSAARIGWRS